MTSPPNLPHSQRWAQVRFAIIGTVLAHAGDQTQGGLRDQLRQLAHQTWQHPITGAPVRFAFSTIERWYYAARHQQEPTMALARQVRKDRGQTQLDEVICTAIATSYREHGSWSYLLHYDNIIAGLASDSPEARRAVPSYHTVRRYMRRHGLIPRHHPSDRHRTPAALATRARFEHREVRQFEHTHTHTLWHTDAHHGSIAISHQGQMLRPVLIAVIDDHSRFICHAQWHMHETAAAVAHTLIYAIAKRGLPRMLQSDNGGPFVAAEITHGLHRLGIIQEHTMCYAPNQNGKMEHWWSTVEGRLMAMLRDQRGLDLYRLNEMTVAWIEHEYHRRHHASLGTTPLTRYQASPHVARPAPSNTVLMQAFTRRETRRQRRSDGSISLGGKRFEIPSTYRHLVNIVVRYASWDLDQVFLAHPETDAILARLLPVDLHANAASARAEMTAPATPVLPASPTTAPGLPPLLQRAVDAARATGLPPAFIPCDHGPSMPVPPAPSP